MDSSNTKMISGVFFMFLIALTALTLAVWQIFRALEKKDFIDKANSRAKSAIELKIDTVTSENSNAESWDQQKLIVTGSWVPNTTIYLDNRSFETRPGVHIISAFKLNDNKSLVWVNRGWAPKLPGKTSANEEYVNGELFLPINSNNEINIEGIAYTSLMKRIELTTDSSILQEGSLWQNLDWNALHLKLNKNSNVNFERIWPFILWQTTNSMDGLKRSLPKVKGDVSKHVGYAIQWMLLFFLALIFAWRIGRN